MHRLLHRFASAMCHTSLGISWRVCPSYSWSHVSAALLPAHINSPMRLCNLSAPCLGHPLVVVVKISTYLCI